MERILEIGLESVAKGINGERTDPVDFSDGGHTRADPSGARLKVKAVDHVAGGHSGVGRRYSLLVWWKRAARLVVRPGLRLAERYGKCVNNVSGVNALDRPRPKKRSFHGQLPPALG